MESSVLHLLAAEEGDGDTLEYPLTTEQPDGPFTITQTGTRWWCEVWVGIDGVEEERGEAGSRGDQGKGNRKGKSEWREKAGDGDILEYSLITEPPDGLFTITQTGRGKEGDLLDRRERGEGRG